MPDTQQTQDGQTPVQLDMSKFQPISSTPALAVRPQPQSDLPPGPPNASGAEEGPDGQLHWHSIDGRDLGPVAGGATPQGASSVHLVQPSSTPPVQLDMNKFQPLNGPTTMGLSSGSTQAPSTNGYAPGVDFRADMGQGFINASKDTARGTVSNLNKASDWIADKLGVQHDKPWSVPFENQNLESQNAGQTIGKFGEGFAEFVLGDEALKGLSYAEKLGIANKLEDLAKTSPKIAKALNIGLNSVRTGIVGGTQSAAKGGTLGDILESAGLTTGATAAIESLTPLVSKGFQFLFDNLNAKKELTGAIEANEARFKESKRTLTDAASTASGEQTTNFKGQSFTAQTGLPEPKPGTRLVSQLQQALEDESKLYRENYGKQIQPFLSHLDEQQIPVGGEGSPLSQIASKLLNENSSVPEGLQPGLRKISSDLEKTRPLLEAFTQEGPMTFNEAESTRQILGRTIRDLPFDDPSRRVLISLRSGIDQSMEEAFDEAGLPDASAKLKNLRNTYATSVQTLEDNAVIKAIRDKDPDSVVNILMTRSSAANMEALEGALKNHSYLVNDVRSSLFASLLKKSQAVDEAGSLGVDAKTLFKNFENIEPDIRKALWGDATQGLQKIVADYKNATLQTSNLAKQKEALIASQQSIGHFFGAHSGGAVFGAKLLYDLANGDYDKAEKDLLLGAAFYGGKGLLSVPAVQKGILSTLELISTQRNQGLIKGFSDPEAEIKAAVRPQGFHAGIPLGDTGAGDVEQKVGLPANTRVTPQSIPSFIKEAGLIDKGEAAPGIWRVESPNAPGHNILINEKDITDANSIRIKAADGLEKWATQSGYDTQAGRKTPGQLRGYANELRAEREQAVAEVLSKQKTGPQTLAEMRAASPAPKSSVSRSIDLTSELNNLGHVSEIASPEQLDSLKQLGVKTEAEQKFQQNFGNEFKEAGDLAEWETGSREGSTDAQKLAGWKTPARDLTKTMTPQGKIQLGQMLRDKFSKSVPPNILSKMSDEDLVERYFEDFEKQKSKLLAQAEARAQGVKGGVDEEDAVKPPRKITEDDLKEQLEKTQRRTSTVPDENGVLRTYDESTHPRYAKMSPQGKTDFQTWMQDSGRLDRITKGYDPNKVVKGSEYYLNRSLTNALNDYDDKIAAEGRRTVRTNLAAQNAKSAAEKSASDKKSMQDFVTNALKDKKLSAEQASIFSDWKGLGGKEPLTQAQLAEKLGVTQAAISQRLKTIGKIYSDY